MASDLASYTVVLHPTTAKDLKHIALDQDTTIKSLLTKYVEQGVARDSKKIKREGK